MKSGKGNKSTIVIDLRNNSQKDVVIKGLKSSAQYSVERMEGKDGVYTIVVEHSPRSGKTARRAKYAVFTDARPAIKKTSYVEKIADSCGLLLEKKTERPPQKAFSQLALAEE